MSYKYANIIKISFSKQLSLFRHIGQFLIIFFLVQQSCPPLPSRKKLFYFVKNVHFEKINFNSNLITALTINV